MLGKEFAEQFVLEWISAWNAHDLDRILALYTDDFEMTSPYIAQLQEVPSGMLKGKPSVGHYWRRALERMPGLKFEPISSLVGVDSLVFHYHGARGLAAEVFFFDEAGKVKKACAHYA